MADQGRSRNGKDACPEKEKSDRSGTGIFLIVQRFTWRVGALKGSSTLMLDGVKCIAVRGEWGKILDFGRAQDEGYWSKTFAARG
jgi:hypothetical protein